MTAAGISTAWRPRRSVGTQALLLASSTGLAQGLVAIVYLFAARGSDPSDFGLTVAAVALGLAAAGFIDFGTSSHWVREVASGRMRTAELGTRTLNKLGFATLIALLWFLVSVSLMPASSLWIAAPVMLGLVINLSSQVPLRGNARGELVAISIVVERLAASALFAALILLGGNPTTALWVALVFGSLTATYINWVMTPRAARPILAWSAVTNPWRGSRYYGIAGMANSAQSLDLTILSLIAGPAAAGIYGAVNRWTQPMGLLAGAFASASAPFVARSASFHNAWQNLRRSVWMPVVAIGIALFVFFLAPILVPLLLGDAYVGSVDVLRVLALATIPSIISQPLYVALQSLGYDRHVAFAMVCLVLPQLATVLILGSLFGALGAAWASLSVQLLLVAVLCGILVRVILQHRRRKTIEDDRVEEAVE